MKVKAAPQGFNYDFRSICFFEIDSDGDIHVFASDKSSIQRKTPDSIYTAYQRALAGDCKIYVAFPESASHTVIYYVEHLDDIAISLGLPRKDEHVHEIHAKFSEKDDGKDTYAYLDVEFKCGCTVSSDNIRDIANYLKDQYGWEVVISYVNFIPETTKTLKIKRKSLSKTPLPF